MEGTDTDQKMCVLAEECTKCSQDMHIPQGHWRSCIMAGGHITQSPDMHIGLLGIVQMHKNAVST